MVASARQQPGATLARRGLDPVAVERALRRIARAGEPPWLHRETARRLVEHLDPLRVRPSRVIDWWAGPGGMTAALAARFPGAEVVRVEPSSEWPKIEAGRARRWWVPRAAAQVHRTVDDDLRNDGSLAPAQLIVSNMALHGVVDVPALFSRWHSMLDVDGVVAFSCLGPGSLPELRALYASRGWPPPAPAFTDMHDLGDMLMAAGFADPVLDQEMLSLSWSSPSALLDELRGLGGNAAPDRYTGLRTPRFLDALVAALAERADAAGRIVLSFEIAYGHGFKPPPRPAAGAPATVSLATLRDRIGRR